jgi:hypothetical protein
VSKKKAAEAIALANIEPLIHVVRGVRVMLDSDLAEIYGISTRNLNQAVDRNRDRFPDDFAFQLTLQEFRNLMSQIVTSSSGYGGRRKLPWVFTEHGVAMLTSVLRSPQAVQMNIQIMRAFVRVRRLLATPGELVAIVQQLSDTVNMHDEQIRVISDVLRKMLEPPPVQTPKRRIGFQPPEPPPPPAPSKN